MLMHAFKNPSSIFHILGHSHRYCVLAVNLEVEKAPGHRVAEQSCVDKVQT